MSQLALRGAIAFLGGWSLMAGCGGGGNSAPAQTNPFAATYKGIYYITAGPDAGEARFFTLTVRPNGALVDAGGSFNSGAGAIQNDGRIDFTRRERDNSTTTVSGQFTSNGTGTLTFRNTGGLVAIASLARPNTDANSFAGTYYGTARVRTGADIGLVEVVTVSVAANGSATVFFQNVNGSTRQATGQANLTSGELIATGISDGGALLVTLQLSKTAQAGGVFETPLRRGTVALNKP